MKKPDPVQQFAQIFKAALTQALTEVLEESDLSSLTKGATGGVLKSPPVLEDSKEITVSKVKHTPVRGKVTQSEQSEDSFEPRTSKSTIEFEDGQGKPPQSDTSSEPSPPKPLPARRRRDALKLPVVSGRWAQPLAFVARFNFLDETVATRASMFRTTVAKINALDEGKSFPDVDKDSEFTPQQIQSARDHVAKFEDSDGASDILEALDALQPGERPVTPAKDAPVQSKTSPVQKVVQSEDELDDVLEDVEETPGVAQESSDSEDELNLDELLEGV